MGITSADVDASLEYRKCQARHDGAVSSFDALADAYDKLRSAIVDGVRGKKHAK